VVLLVSFAYKRTEIPNSAQRLSEHLCCAPSFLVQRASTGTVQVHAEVGSWRIAPVSTLSLWQVMHHTCSACKPQCAGSRLRKLCHKGSICHDDERRNSRAGDALAGQGQSGAPGGLRSSVAVCPMQAGACHHTKTAEWSAAASLHSSLYEFMSAARARQHSAHSGQGACAVPPDRLLGRLHTL